MLKSKEILPVEIVLAPSWWFRHAGITFDRDFFFHPLRRVEVEKQMERLLYERWGKYGLGKDRRTERPEIGAVHLAAGFMLSEMLGCEVRYADDNPPQVVPANIDRLEIDEEMPFKTKTYLDFLQLQSSLIEKYHYLTGDVNWGGILNIALDLRGQQLFIDMMEQQENVHRFFRSIRNVIDRFVSQIEKRTGSSSISVNRNLIHLSKPVFLHSECSHTMISEDIYRTFLLEYDLQWCREKESFGIHYCGKDPHRFASVYAELPRLDFMDVGWGGDLKVLRGYLPDTFLNIRLSPVELVEQSHDQIDKSIRNRVVDAANPVLTGVCCINMDDRVSDDRISQIFESVGLLRKELQGSAFFKIN